MSDVMDCLQIAAWGGDLERTVTPAPEPGTTDVLVEVEATGVGRTVYNVIAGNLGDAPGDLPRIPGHEVVGRVVEAGAGVDHVGPGDRIAAYFHLVCGYCEPCRAGSDSLCTNHAGWVSVDIDGGYAEYVRLPAGNAIPIPDGIDAVEATAIPDAIATPYHVANTTGGVRPGDEVAVLGAGGGVGIHMVQMARYFGARVTAVDIVDAKLDRCLEYGAEAAVNSADRSIADVAAERHGGFDLIVDFTGETALLEAAVDALGRQGRLVNLTTFGNTMAVSPRAQVSAERQVVGSRYCAKHELYRAGQLVGAGHIEPVVSEVVGFDGVADLLESIADNEVFGRGAMTPA